jgi:hypothetical protein
VSLLSDSFGAINDRFHLAGSYAFVAVLFRVTTALADKDETWVPLASVVFILYHAAGCGILGLVYQAAVRRSPSISFWRYAVALFAPILWLSLKVLLMVYGVVAVGGGSYVLARGGDLPLEMFTAKLSYWGAPIFGLAAQILLLYSLPIGIAARERGERGPHVRMGLLVLKARPSESVRLRRPAPADRRAGRGSADRPRLRRQEPPRHPGGADPVCELLPGAGRAVRRACVALLRPVRTVPGPGEPAPGFRPAGVIGRVRHARPAKASARSAHLAQFPQCRSPRTGLTQEKVRCSGRSRARRITASFLVRRNGVRIRIGDPSPADNARSRARKKTGRPSGNGLALRMPE